MSNESDRIRLIISHFCESPADFARKMGEKPQTVSNWITRGVGKNVIDKIVTGFPEVNIDWLLTGEGEMLKGSAQKNKDAILRIEQDYTLKNFFKDYYSYLDYSIIDNSIVSKQLIELTDKEKEIVANKMGLDYQDFANGIEIVTRNPSNGKLVPIYDTRAAAGNSQVELTGTKKGWVNIGDILKDSEGAIYIYGNSMIPGYPPGSLIGVRPLNETFIEPGSVYVIQTESNRYIKRLYYNEGKTALICISDNHIKHTDGPMEGQYYYPPFEIPFSSIKCIYAVTGVIKRNSIMMS